jgi:hypothetical protein
MASKKKATKKTAKETTETKGAANEPESKLTNLQDNSVSPAEMSELRGNKDSKLAASTETAEKMEEESTERKEDEDNSTHGRLSRSGFVLNEDMVTGDRWVGIPYSQDAEELKKGHKVRVTPISEVRPWTGLQVRPKNGEPFAVPEVSKDESPAFWLGLMIPDTNSNFIEA